MSYVNLLGAVLYIGIMAASLAAVVAALRAARPAAERLHWLGISAGFALLAVMRATQSEDHLRTALREAIRQQGDYGLRGEYQSILASAIILAGAAAVLLAIYMRRHWPRSRLAQSIMLARLALAAYVPLMALRLISFHATDRLLYAGPVHLNWLIDGGLALVCGACALYYARSAASPRRSKSRKP